MARRLDTIEQLIIAQGGPDGEEIDINDIVQPEIIDLWSPLRINEDGEIAINYVDHSRPSFKSNSMGRMG
jgi:hypothetical protein